VRTREHKRNALAVGEGKMFGRERSNRR